MAPIWLSTVDPGVALTGKAILTKMDFRVQAADDVVREHLASSR